MLHVPHLEAIAIADQILRVGFEVVVRVAHEPEVRWLCDEDATLEHLQGARQHETVEEDRLLVHLPVAVRVLKHDDAPARLTFVRRFQVGHVPEQLDDPHPAPRIPVDDDGILDHGLASDEFHVVSGRQEEGLHLVLRGKDGCLRIGGIERRRPLSFALTSVCRHAGGDDGEEHERRSSSRHEGSGGRTSRRPPSIGNLRKIGRIGLRCQYTFLVLLAMIAAHKGAT